MPRDTLEVAENGLEELARVRADVVTAFDRLSRNLGTANDGLADVGQEVARLHALLARLDAGGGLAGALPAVCDEVGGLVAAVAEELGRPDFGEGLARGGAATAAILRETRQLIMVAAISRITGTATGIDHIDGFVTSLREMTGALADAAAAMDRAIAAIAGRRDTALDHMRHAAEATRRSRRSGAAANADIDRLQRRNQSLAQALETLSGRLEGTGRTETGALISGIQHADELSQRLEHVGTILSDTSVEPAAAQALAAAQIAAACADTRAVLARLRTALARMREGGRHAADTLAGDIGAEAEALLDGLGAELAEATQLEALLGPALAAALEAAGAVREGVAAGRTGGERLRETARRITLVSVNAGLLAGRSGVSKAAMDFLSASVRESAALCNAQSDACQDAFTGIGAMVGSSSLPQLEARSRALQEALAEVRARHRAVADGVSELAALRGSARAAATALSAAIDESLAALATLPAAVDALQRLGSLLARPEAVPQTALDTLGPLMEIYTMQCERDVHARLCGVGAAVVPAAAAQSLEDIFF